MNSSKGWRFATRQLIQFLCADDAIASGVNWENQTGSYVGGALTLFAERALLARSIKQDAIAATNALELRRSIGGNMQVTAVGASPCG